MKTDTHLDQAELTRKIIGALYTVYNGVGYGYQEKYYQRALALELEKIGVRYERERSMPIKYEGRIIGRYFMDFVVEATVVVELKIGNEIYQTAMNQLLNYLRSAGLTVGLIGLITPKGVRIKRVVL